MISNFLFLKSVMSIGFVLFQDHPNVMKSITDQINKVIKKLDFFEGKGCLAIVCCAPCLICRFGSILRIIDQKIGELGIPRVAEFISSIIEIFCRFFNRKFNFDDLIKVSESIQSMIKAIGTAIKPIFGSRAPDPNRKTKWSPLSIADNIRARTDKFQTKSPIVIRTVDSFAKLFKSIETCESSMEKRIQDQHKKKANQKDEDIHKEESSATRPLLQKDIEREQEETVKEITHTGRFFQHLETIMTYGILAFSNEDEVLTPILDNLDECTRILDKFGKLHIIYKLLCGKNYLSKMKQCMSNIIHLLEKSNLKINSPQQFLAEVQKTYPNLLAMIFDLSFDGQKPFAGLPVEAQKAINTVINNINKIGSGAGIDLGNEAGQLINNISDGKVPAQAQQIIGGAVNDIGKRFGFKF
jgi:hypothetical protein